MFLITIQILSALSGVAVLCVAIKKLYFWLWPKKLYYAHKVYPISDKIFFHLLSIWNPTYHKILSNDITKTIAVSMGENDGNFHIVVYTDKCLTENIKIQEKYHLILNFSCFPSKSGILLSYISNNSSIYIEGSIKNHSIKEVNYTFGKYPIITCFIITVLLIILSVIQFSTGIVEKYWIFVLFGCFILFLILYFIELSFSYPKMPKALWEAFKGKTFWH